MQKYIENKAAFCPSARASIALDSSQDECADRHNCQGHHCPLEQAFYVRYTAADRPCVPPLVWSLPLLGILD